MSASKSFLAVIVLLGLLLVGSSVYEVHEGQHALLLRLGKIVTNKEGQPAVMSPGLHFKLPFVNSVRIFDTRLQTLANKTSRIVTREKKDVLVDYYIKWRIADLALYYTRTGGNELQAQTLLEQKINDGLRAEFGKRNISDVVSGERTDIMEILRKQADTSAASLGIDVVDVRIKRIDLPSEVSMAVFDRMRAEREQIANAHRSEGKAVAENIRAEADAKVTVILATARSNAVRKRGEGDATAAKIYANAYDQNPSFFALLRSLEAYQKAFNNKRDVLVLKPNNQFFSYFNEANSKNNNKQGS
jgi:modulator of FtsH protease HflC